MAGISRVVLYKHGVGFFERIEEVEGHQELRLSFRSAQMNDVLKSLTVLDLDGGSVHSVSYDTQKPVEMLLSEVALDLPPEGGQAALLSRVRGARVKVAVGSRDLEGRIVGVEESEKRTADGILRSALLTVIDGAGRLHTADLSEVASLSFLDDHIRRDLQFYYETLVAATKRDARSLSIHARGEGRRRIQVGYVTECPVWKTAYRVSLPQDGEKPFLQGWALVDNTQDEDWEEVHLSLVAGLPISFVHDLYTPRYIQRREVRVEQDAAAGPVMAQAATGGFLDDLEAQFAVPPAPPAASPTMSLRAAPAAPLRRQAAREMAAQTVTQSLGDLFEYSIDHPVTVHRNQSALVPIVGDELEGRRIVLYNPGEREQNPFAAFELTNSTGLTLEGGPVVVFEGETYAGEAMLDTVKPRDRRIVSFAVDLGVLVDSLGEQSEEEVHMVVARQGRLYLHSGTVSTRTYTLANKDDRDKTCILEHPRRPAWELFETPEPKESTASFYRFELELAAGKTTEFVVRERRSRAEAIQLSSLGSEQLSVYVSRGYFDAEQERALGEVATMCDSLSKLRGKLAESKAKKLAVAEDQGRLRENLKSLGSSADEQRLRSRYVQSLEQQETIVESLGQLVGRLEQEIDKRQDELERAAAALDFEHLRSLRAAAG